MAQQPDPADAPPALPALKIVEPEVDAEDPWGDDVLKRREIADRLTSIVRRQEAPFVISLDGRWGTGKTFLLKRWRQDLENQGLGMTIRSGPTVMIQLAPPGRRDQFPLAPPSANLVRRRR